MPSITVRTGAVVEWGVAGPDQIAVRPDTYARLREALQEFERVERVCTPTGLRELFPALRM